MTKRIFFFLCLLGFFAAYSRAQQRLTLLFVGDLMQHQGQIDAALTTNGRYDYSPCFSLVSDRIADADLAIGNLEVTLGGPPYRGYPAFSAPDEYLLAIRDAGFDVLTTGNNHCLDRGRRGLERTIARLDDLGIPHAGTYIDSVERSRRYPLFVRKNGFLIAFLNYTYDTNGLRPTGTNIVNYIDRDQIARDIAGAQARQPDAIIALMHWGNEYQSLPSREQRRLADWLLDRGVTHIIGCHPHVVQPMEVRTEGRHRHVVVYSLGNFISNMQHQRTDGGLIFTMTLEKYPMPTAPVGSPFAPFDDFCYKPGREPFDMMDYGGVADTLNAMESHAYPYPYCRLVDCGYSLVWTARPPHHPGTNFILVPIPPVGSGSSSPVAGPSNPLNRQGQSAQGQSVRGLSVPSTPSVSSTPSIIDLLTPEARRLMDRFVHDTRQLMRDNYGGIDELME